MAARSVALLVLSCLASGMAFVGIGVTPKRWVSLHLGRRNVAGNSRSSAVRPRVRSATAPLAMMAGEDGTSADGGQGAEEEDEDDKTDPDAEGVAKMRASEIKAELDMRGVGYTGIFEKDELVERLIEARSLGRADPSIIDDFNKENLENRMDPERAAGFADDLLNEEKLKDLTAADGTLPGGMTPEMLSKMVSNPELMVLMQNPKLQEIMKKVMADGPEAMEELQGDPETAELLKKLEAAMGGMQPQA
ncbi:conserved unknown protein [Ectocarpus siliculosus]|uniref:STI1 domain-containing protein n=1 Tax=Ectocarpus siliculosus TaxID=2880 RepID=D7FYD4_ECTSI|nr:conserved unknown protein [Ectocarpus siliculosus]|eukprot:CBJ32476.1 conserved unknown protein [Ectocarpus siliculosus]